MSMPENACSDHSNDHSKGDMEASLTSELKNDASWRKDLLRKAFDARMSATTYSTVLLQVCGEVIGGCGCGASGCTCGVDDSDSEDYGWDAYQMNYTIISEVLLVSPPPSVHIHRFS
ncbi:hypothetical protein HDU77_002066 [Chytriomyces hyalinus]|nr:hypothetical protein HDU77_002066 [Chytriomyces hyalinus]